MSILNERERQLGEILLLRGFPVEPVKGGLAFCKGCLPEDDAYLLNVLRGAPSRTREGEPAARLRLTRQWIDLTDGQIRYLERYWSRRRYRHVFGEVSIRGKDIPRFQTWESFRKTRYGASVPVEKLDAEIALMVKVLPWYGVWTIMSCRGKPQRKESAYIAMMGPYHLAWWEAVMWTLAPRFWSWDFMSFAVLEEEPGWLDYRWDICYWPWRLNDTLVTEVNHLARLMINREVSQAVRAAKDPCGSPEDFREALAGLELPTRTPFTEGLANWRKSR